MKPGVFFENFELLADAPNGIQKLRELILQLAVMGKLVEQDPNDEPANALIERIKVKKKRDTKGKDEDESKVSQIVENEQLSLPPSWFLVRLGDLIYSIIGGGTPSKRNSDYWEGEIPWASVKDLGKGKYLEHTIDKINEEGIRQSSTNLIPKGRIIVCTRMGLGKIAINKIDVAINQDLKALHLCEEIDLNYFYNFYLTQNITGNGMTVKGIRQEELLNILIPLPPLAEQKRIVSKVDELMALCDKLEARRQKKQELQSKLNSAALDRMLNAENQEEFEQNWQRICENFDLLYDNPENVGKLRKAILQLAVQGKVVEQNPEDEPASVLVENIEAEKKNLVKVGKIKKNESFPEIGTGEIPYDLPESWEWIRLGNLCELITKGSSPKWQGISYVEKSDGILFVTSENVNNYSVNLDKEKYVEPKFNEIEPRSILKRNDILMNIVGASIGRTAVYESDKIANINQAVCLIRVIGQNELVNLRYLLYFFNSSTCISYMFDKQVDNARANLSMGNISKFAIPLPPLEEQKRIVEKVEQLMGLCDELESKLRKSQEDSEKLMEMVVRGLLEGTVAEI